MSIPTHNLYDFIHQVTEKKFWLVLFYPWGTRKIENLIEQNSIESVDINEKDWVCKKIFPKQLISYYEIRQFQPILLCHDQEPLNFDLHKNLSDQTHPTWSKKRMEHFVISDDYNLRYFIPGHYQKYWILLHSELNSSEVKKYEETNRFIGAYWWSHAIISKDWYRFAEFDKNLQKSIIEKTFLVYNRSQTGSRLYREKFNQLLHKNNLTEACLLPSGNEHNISSNLSATYHAADFNKTEFSVVLETIADSRIHLTEKTLRPIAVGHPFLLMAGPNSLEYLKKYGFKTFSPWINEEYDKQHDQDIRMQFVINEMKRIVNLPDNEKEIIIQECYKIARYNKEIFFSKKFQNTVINELKDNVKEAFLKTENKIDWKYMLKLRWFRKKIKSTYILRDERVKYLILLCKHLKKGGTLEDYVPPDLD